MCPWVGPHAPSFGRQLWGLPSRVVYLSPQGVLLPLVYRTTASPLWLELRGHSAWQATPSWTVYRLACHRLLPWLRVTFAIGMQIRGEFDLNLANSLRIRSDCEFAANSP